MSFETVNYMVVLLDITIKLGALHMIRRHRQHLENSRGGFQSGARMSSSMLFSVISSVSSTAKSLRMTGNTMKTVLPSPNYHEAFSNFISPIYTFGFGSAEQEVLFHAKWIKKLRKKKCSAAGKKRAESGAKETAAVRLLPRSDGHFVRVLREARP
jgi:hypothetical protein